MGGPLDLQDALAQDQAAGAAELDFEFWALLRDAAGRLAVLRRYFFCLRNAAHPLHALDAGRALVHDDLHVRRDAQVPHARDVARGRRRRDGRGEAPGRLDREVDLLLARAPPSPPPPARGLYNA